MSDDKKWPKYYPGHTVNCKCTLYGLDEETTAQLKAIAKEVDRMMTEVSEAADMTGYYETLEGHNERRH